MKAYKNPSPKENSVAKHTVWSPQEKTKKNSGKNDKVNATAEPVAATQNKTAAKNNLSGKSKIKKLNNQNHKNWILIFLRMTYLHQILVLSVIRRGMYIKIALMTDLNIFVTVAV